LAQPREAIERFNRSLELDPNFAQPLCSRGTVLISLGEFAQGWQEYELRVRCPQYDVRTFAQPQWDGTPLTDRTLLVHCEQGLGDTLQFIRYVRLVRKRASQVIVAVPPALMRLLADSGFENLVSSIEPLPKFDLHVPLMSLPHVLGTTRDNV